MIPPRTTHPHAIALNEVQARDSVEQLYADHVDDVARWVSYLVGRDSDVEDLVHEVFVVALKRWGEFRGEASPKTWLYRITINLVRNHRRRQKFRRWLNLTREVEEQLESKLPSPESVAITRDQQQLVYRILDELGERQRTILVLFELDGLSGEEVAAILGMRTASVWVALHRARTSFAQKLASSGGMR